MNNKNFAIVEFDLRSTDKCTGKKEQDIQMSDWIYEVLSMCNTSIDGQTYDFFI